MKKIDPILKQYLKEHGSHSFAYSTIQPAAQQFIVEGAGYVSFLEHKGRVFALSDPVVSREAKLDVLSDFIREYERPCFLQAGQDTAAFLSNEGYLVNPMGIETSLEFPEEGKASAFYSRGNKRRIVRKTAKNYTGKDYSTQILTLGELIDEKGVDPEDLNGLSEEWMAQKEGDEELQGLARPYVPDDEEDVLKMYVFNKDQLLGFAVFDPVYQDNEVVAYSANMFRFVPEAPKGRSYHAVLSMMDYLQSSTDLKTNSGTPIKACSIKLGLTPLYVPDTMNVVNFEGSGLKSVETDEFLKHFNQSWMVSKIFQEAYKRNFGYSFQGLAEHKRQYRGTETPTYYASHKSNNRLVELVRAFQANRILKDF